ncbi:MAG: HAMP domain-containing histidine kinase, partial [Gammaproteobacteria bacterium]|nr:HAMP domain-containing histidine kinase [Gammaproteobacteria bacterium]
TQEFINDIMQAGHNLLDLVNQVLNLSRIDTGQLHMQLEPVLLHNVVTECVTQINTSVAKKFKIQLINNINAPNLVVMADVQGIRQVLTNILTNAVKYNRSDGSVTIKSEPVDKDRIRILISDTGKGIAKNDIDKLFNPFERLSFRDGAIGGIGIGLTVAKQLVEAMKGTMGVTSIIDQGSTFWVELPLVLIEDL